MLPDRLRDRASLTRETEDVDGGGDVDILGGEEESSISA